MNRQRLLVLGGAAVTTAVAGCLGDDEDDGDVEFDDPEVVVELWLEALVDPDFDKMEVLAHEDIARSSPLDLPHDEQRDYAGTVESWERTIREVSIVDEDDETVVVEAEVTDNAPSGAYMNSVTYVLRLEDGDWKMYDLVDGSGIELEGE